MTSEIELGSSRLVHFDVSPSLDSQLPVWPGDTPLRREILLDQATGSSVTLSTLHATTHLGAHADAPLHYAPGAPSIEQRSLEYYLGPCEVLGVAAARNGVLGPESLPGLIRTRRVLIRTGTFPEFRQFNTDFAALSPALIDFLADSGVCTIGVDTPSIDPFDSKDLPAHRACLRRDLAILEGLVLRDVPDGLYELIALPLRLVGFDASPVRAILRPISGRSPDERSPVARAARTD